MQQEYSTLSVHLQNLSHTLLKPYRSMGSLLLGVVTCGLVSNTPNRRGNNNSQGAIDVADVCCSCFSATDCFDPRGLLVLLIIMLVIMAAVLAAWLLFAYVLLFLVAAFFVVSQIVNAFAWLLDENAYCSFFGLLRFCLIVGMTYVLCRYAIFPLTDKLFIHPGLTIQGHLIPMGLQAGLAVSLAVSLGVAVSALLLFIGDKYLWKSVLGRSSAEVNCQELEGGRQVLALKINRPLLCINVFSSLVGVSSGIIFFVYFPKTFSVFSLPSLVVVSCFVGTFSLFFVNLVLQKVYSQGVCPSRDLPPVTHGLTQGWKAKELTGHTAIHLSPCSSAGDVNGPFSLIEVSQNLATEGV